MVVNCDSIHYRGLQGIDQDLVVKRFEWKGLTAFVRDIVRGAAQAISTVPYLHDGRAATLTEAILFHGGDAEKSRQLFKQASTADKTDLLAFLNNLVLHLQ